MVEEVVFRNCTGLGSVRKPKDPGAGEFVAGKVALCRVGFVNKSVRRVLLINHNAGVS